MSNKKRIGLWKHTSSKGTVYLSGKDDESSLRYMVFKEDNGSRRLVSKPINDNEAPLTPVTTFLAAETKEGTPYYKSLDGMAIFANDFYEEGSKKPEFNLVIG